MTDQRQEQATRTGTGWIDAIALYGQALRVQ